MANKNIQKERKKQIIIALHNCLLEKTYYETTIKDIAQKAGLNHGVLHYYFESKEQILLEYVDYILEVFLEFINKLDRIDINSKENKPLLKKIFLLAREQIDNLSEFFKVYFEVCGIASYNDNVRSKLQASLKEIEIESVKFFKKFYTDEKQARVASKSFISFFEGIALTTAINEYSEKDIMELVEDLSSWSEIHKITIENK